MGRLSPRAIDTIGANDGDSLTYDAASDRYKPTAAPASGATTLDGLTDVDTSTTPPTNGQVLEYNGTLWVPATPSATAGVQSVVPGTGIAVDNTDPANPVVSATGSGGGSGSGGRVVLKQVTLAAAAAKVSFTAADIPTTGYNHLRLVLKARSSSSSLGAGQDFPFVQFNGDTATANYTSRTFFLAGSSNSFAGTGLIGYIPGSGAPAGSAGQLDASIPFYRGTTWPKQVRSNFGFRYGSTTPAVGDTFLEWANTAAITSIDLVLPSGGNFEAGSTFMLYGEQ